MSEFVVTPPTLPRPPRRVWLPLVLSLAIHALFALSAVLLSAGEDAHAGGPVPIDAVVLADGGGTIILDGRTVEKPARGAAPQRLDEEPSDEVILAKVEPAPIQTLVTVPSASASGFPTEGGAGSGTSAGGGMGAGVLRAPSMARKVVYVIDRSMSMGIGGALSVAKRELLAGINALPADARFAVILYNRQVEPLSLGGEAGLVPATAVNRAEASRLVDEVRAQGGTDHLAALRRAVALEPDVIFFVTDADDMTAEQVHNVTLLNRARAAIHTVEVNDEQEGREDAPLKLLARRNGGTHRVVRIKR
jgi:von Willebrand factor type A domain